MFNKVLYILATTTLLLNCQAKADDDGFKTYTLEKIASFSKIQEKTVISQNSEILMDRNFELQLNDKDGSCTAYNNEHTPFSIDKDLLSEMQSVGGQTAFNLFLQKELNVSLAEFKLRLRSFHSSSNDKYCRFIANNSVYSTVNNLYIVNSPYIYKYTLKQKRKEDIQTEKQQEFNEKGLYKTIDLPFTDLDYFCTSTHCRSIFRVDESIPKSIPQDLKIPFMESFYALPAIEGIKVFLGGAVREHEILVNGKSELGENEDLIYLITIKDRKVNYVRLGKKFTIGKDYSIIKTLDSSKKLIKYTIASTGVIYKVQ